MLNAYGVATTECWPAQTPEEAAALAAKLSRSLALKINSPDITHKSDVGGVVLNLDTPDAVGNAASSMLDRIRGAVPGATVHGFTLQPMIRRQSAFELIIGMTVDQQFGPVLLFGHGGTSVEVIQDNYQLRQGAGPQGNLRRGAAGEHGHEAPVRGFRFQHSS